MFTEREFELIRLPIEKQLKDFKFLEASVPNEMTRALIKEYEELLKKLNDINS